MNQVVLTACVVEQKALRYTPAGLPALDLMLEHASEVRQNNQTRQVKLVIKATGFGALAERLAVQPVGSSWRFEGFLATPLNGKHPVLQLQEFQPI